nr:hypothetical protein [Bacillaceae bacterium]
MPAQPLPREIPYRQRGRGRRQKASRAPLHVPFRGRRDAGAFLLLDTSPIPKGTPKSPGGRFYAAALARAFRLPKTGGRPGPPAGRSMGIALPDDGTVPDSFLRFRKEPKSEGFKRPVPASIFSGFPPLP